MTARSKPASPSLTNGPCHTSQTGSSCKPAREAEAAPTAGAYLEQMQRLIRQRVPAILLHAQPRYVVWCTCAALLHAQPWSPQLRSATYRVYASRGSFRWSCVALFGGGLGVDGGDRWLGDRPRRCSTRQGTQAATQRWLSAAEQPAHPPASASASAASTRVRVCLRMSLRYRMRHYGVHLKHSRQASV